MDFRDYDTRLAAYAVIVDERDRMLLALWNEGAELQWTLPGGGVELHETVEDAAVREVQEETGYDVALGPLLAVDSHVVPGSARPNDGGRPLKSVRIVFEGQVLGGELTHEVAGTTDEARWIPVAEVPGLPHVPIVGMVLRLLESARG